VTFSVVCFAWVFFRAPSAGEAIDVLRQLVSGVQSPDVAPVLTPLVVIIIVLAIASQFVPPSFPDRVAKSVSRVAPALQIVGFAVALMLIDALGPEGIAPFIYFQF